MTDHAGVNDDGNLPVILAYTRERERERDRQTDRQTHRHTETETDTEAHAHERLVQGRCPTMRSKLRPAGRKSSAQTITQPSHTSYTGDKQ